MVTSDRRHAIMIPFGSDHSRPAAMRPSALDDEHLGSVMMRKIAAATGPYSE